MYRQFPIRALILVLATATTAAAATTTDNLVPNPDFDSGPWRSHTRRGEAKVNVSSEDGYEETSSLFLSGFGADTAVEAFTDDIAVTPASLLQLDFAWKLAYGAGTLDIRWTGGGYVISLLKPTPGWTTFARERESGAPDHRLHVIRYTKGLGAPDGRETIHGTTIAIPPDVTKIRLHATLRGQGLLAIDAIRLTPIARQSTLDAIDQDEVNRLLIPETPSTPPTPAPAAAATASSPSSTRKLDIRDVILPATHERDPANANWPATASNLRIHDGQFVRADAPGRPVFLMGFESTVVYPWLYKLLGADFVHFQDTCSAAVIRTRKKTGGATEVWWQNYDWLDAQLRRVLTAGLAAHIQPYEELQDVFPGKRMPLYNDHPDLYVNKSHFINYRFEDPDGRRLRENMWRSILGITRKYPVFSYELFNEVRYTDYSPANLAGFRGAMQAKYITIDRANAAWGAAFRSFADMRPPEKSGNAGGTLAGLRPAGFSIPLWVDWQKYIEKVFAGHLAELATFIRATDTSPHVHLTIQSTCDLNQGYSGGNGVYPPLKISSEDFYGAEGGGGSLISQTGGDNFDEIRAMLIPGMTGKLAAFVATTTTRKPLIDIEVAPRGYGRNPVPGTRLVELDHLWKFRPDNARQGEQLGFTDPAHNDASPDWTPITVPGLWGAQGHADCTRGWYRATFRLPPGARPAPAYLNGSKLSDTATLWLNGRRIHRTQTWNERFGIDITAELDPRPASANTLVVSVENNYRDAGMYWGGIRDYLSIDDRPYAADVPLTPGQMRGFLWQKIVHGANGLVPSYAYTPEGDHLSLFNPEKVSPAALRALPLVKQEIANVGDIVLSQNRRLHPIGLLYSFESGRARVPANHEDWVKAAPVKDLATWYAALRFAHLPHNVIYNDALLAGHCDTQRAILLRMAPRLSDGTLAKLETLVRAGATLIIDHGSAITNDDTHAPRHRRARARHGTRGPRPGPAPPRPRR
ncbi:MAG: hypothetical protein LBK99_25005, partial [Opitutaceae bacterium]|nr:hypothetical protein [Opitutaceae bacterium]